MRFAAYASVGILVFYLQTALSNTSNYALDFDGVGKRRHGSGSTSKVELLLSLCPSGSE